MGKQFKKNNFKRKSFKPYNKNKRDNFSKTDRSNRPAYVPRVTLREDEVGITEFISDGIGFTGIIKSRFSDFQVNEIDTDDKVLILNDLNIPRETVETFPEEELNKTREELGKLLTEEQCEQIAQFSETKGNDRTLDIDITSLGKDERTHIHQALKKLYAGKLVSTTVNADKNAPEEKRILRIKNPKDGRDRSRKVWAFPEQYVHFLVYKENMDTSEVVCAMADRMNMRPSQVNYCGTKDKRGKTTQKFCVKWRTPMQIVGSVKALPNVHVGNFEFHNEVLKLGDLRGNRFRIALRNVQGEQEQIESDLEKVRDNGFINYYGLQRFGNCVAVPTYDVGVAILKADYKLACELILKPRDNDAPFMRNIRETWWKDRNSAAAASMFRNDKFIEKKLLDGLAQYGEKDYASALRKIPRNMLLLYTHAFQSLIFNKIASRRIKEFGLKVIPGDLVYRNKNELDENDEDAAETEESASVEQDPKEVDNDVVDNTVQESVYKRKVKALTESDIASGEYTLFDVVLPLPGYDITYPENDTGKWYEELLAEKGLSSEKLRSNVKTYALPGSYRKLVIQPTQMSWKFSTYTNAESDLIQSDWDLLKGRELPKDVDDATGAGEHKALVLDFCLPTSAYATMLLREILKTDTSAGTQAELQRNELANKVTGGNDEVTDENAGAEKRKVESDIQEEEKETKIMKLE